MLRPVPKMAQYKSPIASLYMCGVALTLVVGLWEPQEKCGHGNYEKGLEMLQQNHYLKSVYETPFHERTSS